MNQPFYTFFHKQGDNILHRYVDENGYRHTERKKFSPTFFFRDTRGDNTGWESIEGIPLIPHKFGGIKDTDKALETYKEVENAAIWGYSEYKSQFVAETYGSQIVYDARLIRIITTDIEVYSEEGFPHADEAEHPVTAICCYDHMKDLYEVWGLGEYDHENLPEDLREEVGHLTVNYHYCESEQDLLSQFVNWWISDYPDALSGWNTNTFDIPYLINRITKILGKKVAKALSPFDTINSREVQVNNWHTATIHTIVGVESLDYLDLYKKHTFITRESYTLDHIAYCELGERKMSYEEAGSLHQLYTTDFTKFIAYNIKDTYLVVRLDNKLKLFDLTFTLAYYAKINFAATLSPVKTWESLCFNYLYDKKVAMPFSNFEIGDKKAQYAGAYVKEIGGGRFSWVMSVDLNSMYPHLIQQFNLGPETLIEPEDYPDEVREVLRRNPIINVNKFLKQEIDTTPLEGTDIAITAAGQFFRTDKMSMFSEMTRGLYAERKEIKKSMLRDEQELILVKEELKRRGIS